MSQIDVIRESICYEQLLREGIVNQPVKGEHLLRDSQYPDMKDVLGIDVKATVTNKEVVGDKVMVEGTLNYIVFYTSKEDGESEGDINNKIHEVVFEDKFSNYLELNSDEHNIMCCIDCNVEHIEAEWMNERKVGISGLLILRWEIYKIGEFEYVKDIEGKDDVQVKKENQALNTIKANKDIDFMGKSMLKIPMDKPEVEEILKCDMNLHKKEVKIIDGKVYIECYCKICMLYVGTENQELQTIEDDVYLSKEEELPGVSSDMSSFIDIMVANQKHKVNLDEDDMNRNVDIEFVVKGNIKVYSNEKIEILEDAYSPTMNIELVNDNKEFALIHSIVNSEVVAKETFELENKDERVEEVVAISGYPVINDKTIENDKISLEGEVKTNIIYRLAGDELKYGVINENIPFNTTVDVKGLKDNMSVIVKPHLENIDTTTGGNTISARATVGLNIKSYYKIDKSYIKDIIEGEEEKSDKKSSVTIYVVGDGETLWDLAKKYKTTVSELERLNDIDEEKEIKSGCRLIIPGRAIF